MKNYFNYNSQQLSEDYLRSLSDNQLRKLFLGLRSEINRSRRRRRNIKDLEVDFCWVQLEIKDRSDFRKSRKKQ